MNLADITTKCYILALIIRDDGERLLLGDGAYEFKDSQQHFIANTYANDVVELQGTDGQMLAGQVRRTATQTFAGYIGDATFSKQKIEEARRDFLMFFRKKHYYTAVYVFSDGTAIQRDRGYIVNAPSVPELYQRFPEWSVGLNFEDPNYYEYAEDDLGQEIAAHKVELELSTAMSGGLIWDGDGAVSDDLSYVGTEIPGEGKNFQLADTGTATLKSAELLGDAEQTTYSGKNLININATPTVQYRATPSVSGQTITITSGSDATTSRVVLPITFEANRQMVLSFDAKVIQNDADSSLVSVVCLRTPNTSDTIENIPINTTVGQTNHYTATISATTSNNNTRQLWLYTKATSTAGAVKVEYSNIQLEYGGSETSYEKFVGGVPAPNPEFPQAVNTVTGEQTVKIEGKNLVNQGQYGTGHTQGGITANFAPEAITMSGTSTSGAWPSFTMYADGSFLQQSWWPTATAIDTSKGAFNDTGDYRFTIWIDGNRGTAAANFRYIIGYMDGTVNNTYFPLDDASYSFTVTKPINYISVGVANNVTVDCSVRIQLEKGASGSSYEPYQGQTLPVNLGKNLCRSSRLNGTTQILFEIENSLIQAGTYTLSAVINETTQNNTLSILLADSTAFNVGTMNGSAGETAKGYFTLTSAQAESIRNSAVAVIRLYKSGANFTNPTWAQLEKGSKATSFASYFTPIELAKIGDYQDRIYKENGKWYIEKNVGKVELGSQTWESRSWGFYGGNIADALPPANNNSVAQIVASNFVAVTANNAYGLTGDFTHGIALSLDKSLLARATDITDLATFTAKVSGQSLYYALATPTTTEITNSELIGQLERLRHAHTYADTTNFSITATSPNLPAFLKVIAFGKDATPQGGYVWEDGGTGGATTITVDGVDNAQPIWTVVGPATNPSLTNITTGESIQWTGVVPNGQTLVVNMADMTASLSDANVFEFISGSWITLQAGNNRVSYSATAATGIATLEWNGVVG